ncbi:MAG: SAM-dependent methyltransferase [Oscillospiraceae bacterium]|nr:SAM-dependent methyltransferase [Oscillospiraceae bacterium]
MDHERRWDTFLQIKTTGRDDTKADQYHHPYEPTPYTVLERLAASGFFGQKDVVLDYGCGKGRVGFFLSYRTKARIRGIEYDERIYEGALENRKTTISRVKPDFLLTRAEEYAVPVDVNRCYFFNPFSVEILHAVCARIIESWYEAPRDIFLFFYYPSDEFIAYLMTVDELEFYDEIECEDLFPGNDPRERVMIFWLPGLEMELSGIG